MSAGDFFKRKGLLPKEGSSKLDDEDLLLERTSQTDIFTRDTVVPDVSAEVHAARAMSAQEQSERSVTAPAPQREPPALVPAPDLERIEPEWGPRKLDLLNLQGTQLAREPLDTGFAPVSLGDLELEHDAEPGGALDFVDGHERDLRDHAPFQATGTPLEPKRADTSDVSLFDLYAVGDFTGALQLARIRLDQDPSDEVAQRYVENCTTVLLKMYSARLGSLQRRPQVEVAPDRIRWLSIDHRAGFLLSLIDGSSAIDDILDMSGMPRLDAMRIMVELVGQQVVSLRD